jgi:hypothetical protein
MQVGIAQQLNKIYGDTNWWQIVPIPLADYPIGSIMDNGISRSTNCVFGDEDLQTFPADNRIPTVMDDSGFSLQLQSPSNITAVTVGLNIDTSKSVHILYSNMVYHAVIPDVYSSVLAASNSVCLRTLKSLTTINPNVTILVGYLKAQYMLSTTKNFKFDINAAAYGANGSLVYTNSQGWTVLQTNSAPCFAIIATPRFTLAAKNLSRLFLNAHIATVLIKEVTGENKQYDLDLVKPDFNLAIKAVRPPE